MTVHPTVGTGKSCDRYLPGASWRASESQVYIDRRGTAGTSI